MLKIIPCLYFIQNYHLEAISTNGKVTKSLVKGAGETSAMFDGLDPLTEYTININALSDGTNVEVEQASINCFTAGAFAES